MASAASAQPLPVGVYTLLGNSPSPTADKVTQFVEEALRRTYGRPEELRSRPEAIHSQLVQLAEGASSQLIFVIGNRATVAALAKADEARSVLYPLKLDPVNPRSAGIPFYLFARARTVDALRRTPGEPLRIAVGVSPKTRDLFNSDEARRVLQPVLGVLPTVVRTTTDPGDLLDALLADEKDTQKRLDLVGIYDEEPSVLVHDFLEMYRPRAPLGAGELRVQLFLLPTKDPRWGPELRPAGQFGSAFAIGPDENLRFHDLSAFLPRDGSDGFITLAPPVTAKLPAAMTEMPVILTNVRARRGDGPAARRELDRVRQIVSLAYLATLLTDEAGKRCTGTPSALFQAYLLQAFFTDADSLPKGLSLWTNLQFTTTPTDRSQPKVESDLIEWMVNQRLKPLDTSLNKLDYRKVVGSMAPASARLSVREQFTHDDAELFRSAANRTRAAVENHGANPQALSAARRVLYELLLKRKGATCELPGLGLFGEKGYDPFFYLSIIDSLLSLQPAG